MTGTVLIDRYVLGAVLGRGGMGLVHEAVDLKLQREVAIKLLGSATATAESLRRFSREALAAGSLQHPNVVGVFDTGEQQGRPFLVTELLRGETLRQRLARGPVPVDQARAWALQLAAGLQAAHEKGLIHRDLKPSNIFITSDGWVKILDFGLVKLAESLPDSSEHPSGTIGYMAPEQVRGQPVDARADLFNFGLVLYEMLGGKRAFANVSATETSYAIVLREPAPLPEAVPLQLRKLVSRCLSKDRELRPPSAREVVRLLQTKQPRSLWRFLPAAVLLLPILAMGVLALQRAKPRVPIQIANVAIFPFEGVPAQTALSEGINDLLNLDLSRHLVHSGDFDPVRSVFGRTGASAVHRGRSAALELNAHHFVLGQVDEGGGQLSIKAALYETETGRMVASAAARGAKENLLQLVRRISDQLFEPKPLSLPERDARQRSFERKTTASVPALLAWMESQRLARRGETEEAVSWMKRAVSLDPEFALGQYELSRYSEKFAPEEGEAALERALRLSDRLSLSEQTITNLMVFKLHGHPAAAQEFLVKASRAHPEELDILRLLAEYLYHRGPLLGHSPHESAPYFRRLMELDPMDFEASGYFLALAVLHGQRTVAAQLVARQLSHAPIGVMRASYRLTDAWARGDAPEHDAAMQELRKPGFVPQPMTAVEVWLAATHMDGSDDAQTFAALSPVGKGYQSFQPRALANLLSGHIEAARHDVEDALAAGAAEDTAYYLPWIDTLELVSSSPAQLTKARAAAARLDVVKDPTRAAARQYLLGMLALRANDLKAAKDALRALENLPEIPESSIVADHVLALRARILAAQGKPAEALALYDLQKILIPERYTHFYRRPRDHFFRASLLIALGRPREALPLYEALASNNLIDPVFYPQQQPYTARVYDSLGEKREAIEHYQRFVAMWHDCDPEERPELERAQARLVQLSE
ncbi:MAG TPA: protein kinase [Myxococcales bacterium]|nr:protein kinase [Myxococcales bacterium]